MNPINGASSLPAMAGPAPATSSHQPQTSWPGLATASAGLGVLLDDEAVARFTRYRDLLLERNTQFNLTAVRQPEEIERRLFLNALAMLPWIDQFLGTLSNTTAHTARLIDIGSGAGFPGLALKIARPNLDVTLVDATAKKVAFLQDVISVLEMDKVHAIHGRAEVLGHQSDFRERFMLATARGVAALPQLLEWVLPFLDVGGEALLPKGLDLAEELQAGKRAARKLGGELQSAHVIPPGDTRLVIARKTTLTARSFPRHAGVSRRLPLGGGIG